MAPGPSSPLRPQKETGGPAHMGGGALRGATCPLWASESCVACTALSRESQCTLRSQVCFPRSRNPGHLLKASHRKDSLASKQLRPFTRPVIPSLMDRVQVTSLPSFSPAWPSWGKCPIVAEREQTTGQLPEDSRPGLNKTGAVPLVTSLHSAAGAAVSNWTHSRPDAVRGHCAVENIKQGNTQRVRGDCSKLGGQKRPLKI